MTTRFLTAEPLFGVSAEGDSQHKITGLGRLAAHSYRLFCKDCAVTHDSFKPRDTSLQEYALWRRQLALDNGEVSPDKIDKLAQSISAAASPSSHKKPRSRQGSAAASPGSKRAKKGATTSVRSGGALSAQQSKARNSRQVKASPSGSGADNTTNRKRQRVQQKCKRRRRQKLSAATPPPPGESFAELVWRFAAQLQEPKAKSTVPTRK
eukprot:SAG31_NODE_1706_length_7491_cov_1.948593_8_plen_209_part_00